MRLGLSLVAAAFVVSLVAVRPATAEEPYLAFIEGLRQRGYYDTAIEYIRDAAADPQTPSEIKVQLPYEEGVTLLAGESQIRNADKRKEQLDEAAARFEEFTKNAPKDHPLQSEALMQRARILQNKARVEVWQASMPSNAGNAEAFRQRARELITSARKIFQEAHDRYEKQFAAYPTYIPDEDPKKAEKLEVEQKYMASQFDLAHTLYDEAQTFPEDSEQRKKTLDKAAAAFETMHQKYRSQIAGLFARLWQGKSFEEQGEIRKALGIYNETLSHDSNNPAMQNLQDTARRFRLICLNHPERQDHRLVIDEAMTWRNNARARQRTPIGLGITYEMARAYEAIGDDRTTPEGKKAENYRSARSFAQVIARSASGELRGPAIAMVQRLQSKLNLDAGDPTDFDTAYGQANILLLDDYEKNKADLLKANEANDKKAASKAEADMLATAQEMARLYGLAIKLAKPSLDPEQLAVAYFRLAYSHLISGDNLSAAVLGKYAAQRYRKDYAEIATEAGFISLAAFTSEFNQAKPGRRDFELSQAVEIADQIVEDFPDSDRANDSRMTVGQLYRQNEQPLEAAKWFDQIPPTSDKYPEASLQAGLNYINAFAFASAKEDEKQTLSADELAQLRDDGEKRLQIGIDQTENKLPSDAEAPELLLFCKLALAQLRNADGVYKTEGKKTGAIDLLTKEPHSVVKAVEMPAGKARPNDAGAIASKQNASAVYQTLLRTQMGMQNVDAALQTMDKLEAVAGKDDAGALTAIYESLGRELQRELKQLRQSGQDDRVAETQATFEKFLDKLASVEKGQTFNSLFWMAETFAALGQGASEAGDSKATEFFTKSTSAYDKILSQASADATFLPSADYLTSVKTRLANSQRLSGQYDLAEATLLDVLAKVPNAIDAQRDAARLYEDWAEETSDPAKYEIALNGRSEQNVWGWDITAQRLRRASLQQPDNEQFKTDHYKARYKLAEGGLKLGRLRSDGEKAVSDWSTARRKLVQFITLSADLPKTEYDKFNSVYRDLLSELGEPESDLPLDESQRQLLNVSVEVPEEAEPQAAAPTQDQTPETAETEFPLLPLLGIVGLLVVGVAGYMAMEKMKAKQRREKLASLDVSESSGGSSRSRRGRGRTRSAGKPTGKPKPAAEPASEGGTATKTKPESAAGSSSGSSDSRRRRPGRRR